MGTIDKHCALLPGSHVCTFGPGVIEKIVSFLCSRFTAATGAMVKTALPRVFQEWARARILPAGDVIHAAAYHGEEDATAAVNKNSEDWDYRDATYVKVSIMIASSVGLPHTNCLDVQYEPDVDVNARFRNMPVILRKETYYGQLMHLVVVNVGAIPSVNVSPTTFLLAIIRKAVITSHHPTLNIHYYDKMGPLEVVDITTIPCLVGRVYDRGQWGIIDRSQLVSREIYLE